MTPLPPTTKNPSPPLPTSYPSPTLTHQIKLNHILSCSFSVFLLLHLGLRFFVLLQKKDNQCMSILRVVEAGFQSNRLSELINENLTCKLCSLFFKAACILGNIVLSLKYRSINHYQILGNIEQETCTYKSKR